MRTLFIVIGLLANLCMQAQLVKLYATKEDYVDNHYEEPSATVTLRNFIESKQKFENNVLYYFWSKDNALRYQIGHKTFLVEYNDSLYLNTYSLKNERGERFGHGFVKVRDYDGHIYFESLPSKSMAPAPALSLGIIEKIILHTKPSIFHYYNPETDEVWTMTKEQLTGTLKNDTELFALFNREPYQEDPQVISLYAKAFFVRKELKQKEVSE